jgi:hypothetical protein
LLRGGGNLSSMRLGVNAADEIGPFILPCEANGAGPFADGKTLDGPHVDAARASVLQTSLNSGGQLPTWLFEIVLISIDWKPACNANENRRAGAAHEVPTGAGMRWNMATA